MKRILAILIILFAITFLITLNRTYFGKSDSDKDGIIDDEDSYPEDANFYKKCCVASSTNVLIKPGEKYYPTGCKCINVSCKCKCLGVDWNAYGLEDELDFNEKEKVYITIMAPGIGFRYNNNEYKQNFNKNVIRHTLNRSDLIGEWEIYFFNDFDNPYIYVDYDIFRMM